MSIVGLTDQHAKMEAGPRGKLIRIGFLQKGRREGFGKGVKLYDDEWFNFKPTDSNGTGARLSQLFTRVYGEKPFEIDDVRIPHLSGNFNIESCAWLTASKHTEKGSVFLAQSDGEWVSRLRNSETGKVDRYASGELAHAAIAHDDGSKYGAIRYKGKLYPFQQSMAIDLILTRFNEAMFKEGIAGLGVVTLITHSTYDIPVLISEHYANLNEIVGLMANPFDQTSVETAAKYVPLRNIPLRLYRSEDPVTTPDYRSKDNGMRLNSTRWLLHWQLAPELSLAMSEATNKRTEMMLAAVANMPLLQNGRMPSAEIDDMFSYKDAEELPETVPVKEFPGPDWEELAIDEGDFEDVEDDEQPELEHDADFWLNAALNARGVDALAQAVYKLHEASGVFTNAAATKKAILHICGKDADSESVISAIAKYVNAVADGTAKAAAVKLAEKHYLKVAA